MRSVWQAPASPRGGCYRITFRNTTHQQSRGRRQATIHQRPEAQTMATLHQPAREPAGHVPPLRTSAGQPVSVVHVTAEYYPYARIGGLAEAVNGLANFQQAAGAQVVAILPLYRTVRDV